jgi:NAD(P)-dependent dehydrogenase (short-subunit alcohol dehydrogenase family)
LPPASHKVRSTTDVFAAKIAVVTRGTSGIGYAVSEELLKRGATVFVIGSRKESVEKAGASLAAYKNARFAAVDVTVADEVKGMIGTCVRESGRVLSGLARPLSYRLHAVGRGRAGNDWADPGPDRYRARRENPSENIMFRSVP